MPHIYIYQWITRAISVRHGISIFGFGVNERGETTCIRIRNVPSFLRIQLENGNDAERIRSEARSYLARNKFYRPNGGGMWHTTMGEDIKYTLESRRHFYTTELVGNPLIPKTYSVLTLFFDFPLDRPRYGKSAYGNVSSIDGLAKHIRTLAGVRAVYEDDIWQRFDSTLQFQCLFKLPPCGWVEIKQYTALSDQNVDRCTAARYEWIVKADQIEDAPHMDRIPLLCVMAFDIECYSNDLQSFPKKEDSRDCIFQISVVRAGGTAAADRVLFVLGSPTLNMHIDDTTIVYCDTESKLICSWIQHIQSAHILIGYNIFGYDLDYIVERAKLLNIRKRIDDISMFLPNRIANVGDRRCEWIAPDRARIKYLKCEGRIFIDMLPYVKGRFRLPNYQLHTVANHVLNTGKDPITPRDIFQSYHLIKSETAATSDEITYYALVGKYCMKDSILVSDLFTHLHVWTDLSEMSRICSTSVVDLNVRGQQFKLFCQLYRACFNDYILIPKLSKTEKHKYKGAHVMTPVPGLYFNVAPFDFSSLYPTTIISHNLDSTTLVPDTSDGMQVPDELCHVIEWSEGPTINYRYRYLKSVEGIVPKLLQSLLAKRSEVKRQMKTAEGDLTHILNMRQNAYKLSANSIYGSWGASTSFVPFLPGAMSTTARGRQALSEAQTLIRQFPELEIIYGDTDSVYVRFIDSYVKNWSIADFWSYCRNIEQSLSSQFPPPMALAFEDKLYRLFLITSPKTYVMQVWSEHTTCAAEASISSKGTVLVRRDRCEFTRNCYRMIQERVFAHCETHMTPPALDSILPDLLTYVHQCMHRQLPIESFIFSETYKELDEYKVRSILPEDPIKRARALLHAQCLREEDWPYHKLPKKGAFVGYKMRRRGELMSSGSRVSFVLVRPPLGRSTAAVLLAEDLEYFLQHRHWLRLHVMEYIRTTQPIIDTLLETIYHIPQLLTRMIVQPLVNHMECMLELERIFWAFRQSNRPPAIDPHPRSAVRSRPHSVKSSEAAAANPAKWVCVCGKSYSIMRYVPNHIAKCSAAAAATT